MLASISVPLMGLTDVAVIGRLGDAALLGGLAVGAILFDFIFVGLNFLRAGTIGLTAQALGANDTLEQNAILLRAMLLSCAIGLPLVFFSKGILNVGLYFMQPSESVASAVRIYFLIRILAAPFTLLSYSILGWLFGLGKARLGLALQLLGSGINIGLSIYLGLFKNGGIHGVAWATFYAELVTVMVGIIVVLRIIWLNRPKTHQIMDKKKIWRTMSINSDIMIRSFALIFAFSYFTAMGSRFGDVVLAANAILMNFFMLAAFILDGFANATEQLVGRSIGSKNRLAFDQTIRISGFWSAVVAVALFVVFMIFGPWLVDFLSHNEAIRATAKNYVIWAALTGIFGALAFLMDGVYIGATWTSEMRNLMLLALAIYLFVCSLGVFLWGNHGLWFALEVFLIVRGVSLFYLLKNKRKTVFN